LLAIDSWDIIRVTKLFITTGILGFMCAFYKERTSSLFPSFYIHGVYNFIGVIIPKIILDLKTAGYI